MALLAAAACAGCAVMKVPPGWAEKPEEVRSAVNGAWAEARLVTRHKTPLRGELIAVSKDSLYIANTSFHVVPRDSVKSVRLVWYDPGGEALAGAVILGTFFSISNGWFFIFTGPMWIIGGTFAATVHSHNAFASYPDQGWTYLMRFARYPQGLPLGVDRSNIKMTPYTPVTSPDGWDIASGSTGPGPPGSSAH
jgi:hypothetical protein